MMRLEYTLSRDEDDEEEAFVDARGRFDGEGVGDMIILLEARGEEVTFGSRGERD